MHLRYPTNASSSSHSIRITTVIRHLTMPVNILCFWGRRVWRTYRTATHMAKRWETSWVCQLPWSYEYNLHQWINEQHTRGVEYTDVVVGEGTTAAFIRSSTNLSKVEAKSWEKKNSEWRKRLLKEVEGIKDTKICLKGHDSRFKIYLTSTQKFKIRIFDRAEKFFERKNFCTS